MTRLTTQLPRGVARTSGVEEPSTAKTDELDQLRFPDRIAIEGNELTDRAKLYAALKKAYDRALGSKSHRLPGDKEQD